MCGLKKFPCRPYRTNLAGSGSGLVMLAHIVLDEYLWIIDLGEAERMRQQVTNLLDDLESNLREGGSSLTMHLVYCKYLASIRRSPFCPARDYLMMNDSPTQIHQTLRQERILRLLIVRL